MPLRLSVVICTYNREGVLDKALASLGRQTLDPSLFEILAIDNNSTDRTRDVVAAHQQRMPHLRYVFEERAGTSYARNRGFVEARGDFIGYMDDDAEAAPDWAATAHAFIPDCGWDIFGGPYAALFDVPRPAWYRDAFGSWNLGEQPRELRAEEFLCGTNFFCRREVLHRIGGFDPEVGPVAALRSYGEETDVQIRARRLPDFRGPYYLPQLRVGHRVAPQKLSFWWHVRDSFLNGRCWYAISRRERRPSALLAVPRLTKTCGKLGLDCVGAVFRNRRRYPDIRTYLFERSLRRVGDLGYTCAQIRALVA